MQHVYDVIIIGGGPAGYSAALYASRAGLDVLLIEKMSAGGQMTLTGDIENYPGFDDGIDGFTLGAKMQAGAEKHGTKTELGEVKQVSLEGNIKRVFTDFDEYFSRSIIIATGASPKALGVPDEEKFIGRGVHYCAHCDGRFYKDKTAIVVGGGNSALTDAIYLSHLCKKVILVHRRNSFRASSIYVEQVKSAQNVQLLLDSRLRELIADKRVVGARVESLKSGETFDVSADGIFVSIGRNPESGIFDGILELDSHGYIVAGEDTKTNVDGVFVAGDVRTKALRQIVTAASDGAIAAHFCEEYLRNQAF